VAASGIRSLEGNTVRPGDSGDTLATDLSEAHRPKFVDQ
jgi:hypothetical protein